MSPSEPFTCIYVHCNLSPSQHAHCLDGAPLSLCLAPLWSEPVRLCSSFLSSLLQCPDTSYSPEDHLNYPKPTEKLRWGGVLIWPWNPTKKYRFPCSYSPSTVLTDLTLEPCTLASEKSGFYRVLGMLWFKYAVSCWSQIDLCPWGRSVLSGQFMFSCLVGSLIYWDRIPLCIPS